MTFSVAFHDKESRTWGVGVASKFISVGSVVPWAKAGVGAVATQSFTNYSYGPRGLELLADKDAGKVVDLLTSPDDKKDIRQLGVVDSKGNAAAHTGSKCLDFAGHIIGENFTVQGNILAGSEVVEAMAKEMERDGPILDRIIRTLEAGDSKGGDRRGRQSAAILIATEGKPFEEYSDRLVDIRIDDSVDPFGELRRTAALWEATFYDQEMLNVDDYREEIDNAIRGTQYKSLREWADNNNFSDKFVDGKIGEKTLDVLLKEVRKEW